MVQHNASAEAESAEVIPVGDAIRAALDVAIARTSEKLVVAVSGGRDSMALMYALARWFPAAVATVATYDHGSGAAATDAAALVAAEARRLGLTVIRERAREIKTSEDAWRTARWSFLKRVARAYRAQVATAHTRDDQVETIVMRQMRGTGARGLAALAAPSTIVRPWLPLTRQEVALWAQQESVPYIDDPTNFTRKFFRSRVRLDLLPALEAAHPGFAESMLAIGNRAAEWRCEVDTLVSTLGVCSAPAGAPAAAVRVPARALEQLSDDGLAVIWPALLSRIGVASNKRGAIALVQFARRSRLGQRLELAGGASVLRVKAEAIEHFELRPPPASGQHAAGMQTRLAGAALPSRFGFWRFKSVEATSTPTSTSTSTSTSTADQPDALVPDVWLMPLNAGTRYDVRAWRDGDRIRTAGAPAGRRVARYLSEARVPTIDRRQWPVVLLGDEIVWIPGVCRSLAAPDRPGRPTVIWYRCEREHG